MVAYRSALVLSLQALSWILSLRFASFRMTRLSLQEVQLVFLLGLIRQHDLDRVDK